MYTERDRIPPMRDPERKPESDLSYWGKRVGTVMVVIVLALVILWVPVKEVARWQRVRDANNQIAVINKEIEQTKKLVEVEQQKAQVRIEEAKGIAEAQRIIDQSLTQNYLTYEAIKAQQAMAGSPNDTVIYIPVGNNGIPLVATVDQKQADGE